ncbi:cytosine permease [Pseudomaricurvus alkylphenolicus]|uniref:cytosine permease n=1 Tax=Pseudomaricurvus alkylphenolicus TaxID=1306991 RepID=UPI0014223D97|nr:cytosine permease [Pseudomaricurvus alkylphenolicus]NIB40486.1 cytosine permease [Pseudomaricurvus alkylphenolicus]
MNSNNGVNTRPDGFFHSPVPEDCTKSSWHIALIVVGTLIGIPIFLVSAQVGGSLGLSEALPAFLLGSLVLCVLGVLTSVTGATTRLSTYVLAEFAFGRSGAKIMNFVIALTLIGWYAVTANVFGQAADMAIRAGLGWQLPAWLYVISGSVLMIWIAVVGFSGIDRLAFLLVPLMLFFLLYTNWLTVDHIPGWDVPVALGASMTFSEATSAVIGGYIVGVVIQPDYSRFARNVRQSAWAMVLALGVFYPIVQVLAAIPSVATGQVNLIEIMIALGIGVPAFLLLVLGSWSSNVVGLYSSGLSLATVFSQGRLSSITLAAGVTGTALALSQAQDYFIPFLVLLGILIPPVAAIYVIDVLLVRRGRCATDALKNEPAFNINALLAWALSSGVGYASSNGLVELSGVSALDAAIVAALLYPLLKVQVLFSPLSKKPEIS